MRLKRQLKASLHLSMFALHLENATSAQVVLRKLPATIHWLLEQCVFPSFMQHQLTKLSASGQELGGPMHVVGSEDHVDVSGPCLDPLPILLGEATGDRHLQARSGLLQGLQVAQGPVEPVVGVLTDAAGVEDDHVGFGLGYGRHHPVSLEQACDSLAVMLVHLAPVGAHGV